MGVGFGIYQLRIDADLAVQPLNAALEHIAHTQLAADLLVSTGLSL